MKIEQMKHLNLKAIHAFIKIIHYQTKLKNNKYFFFFLNFN